MNEPNHLPRVAMYCTGCDPINHQFLILINVEWPKWLPWYGMELNLHSPSSSLDPTFAVSGVPHRLATLQWGIRAWWVWRALAVRSSQGDNNQDCSPTGAFSSSLPHTYLLSSRVVGPEWEAYQKTEWATACRCHYNEGFKSAHYESQWVIMWCMLTWTLRVWWVLARPLKRERELPSAELTQTQRGSSSCFSCWSKRSYLYYVMVGSTAYFHMWYSAPEESGFDCVVNRLFPRQIYCQVTCNSTLASLCIA